MSTPQLMCDRYKVNSLGKMAGLQLSLKADFAELALCLERIGNDAEAIQKLADELRAALP